MASKGRTAVGAAAGITLATACAAPVATPSSQPSEGGLVLPMSTPSDGWTLVWSDEFDGATLDRTKWRPEVSCWGGGNEERQCYTDRAANVSVRGGHLRLTARAEAFEGPLMPPELSDGQRRTKRQAFTSGKVRTKDLHAWRYGRISARMRLPGGQGTWPAFWMMPNDPAYGGWPQSGEIDIMEAVNLGTPCAACAGGIETRTSAAIHFGAAWPDNAFVTAMAPESASAAPHQAWRTYAVEWGEGRIQWFVDGELFMRADAEDWNGTDGAPFDQPFYAMLNLAVGGRMSEQANGMGFDPNAFPASLLVDWVRVEACEGDETARACMSEVPWSGALERGP